MPSGALKVTLPTEREIRMTRVFNAPRDLVFEAHSKPELLKRWFGVMAGWSLAVCEIDLRVGGTYRYLWRGPDGAEMGMRGVYREVQAPERIVATEKFDQSWYAGDAESSITMVEQDGKTTVTLSVRYESKEVRDAVLQSPMEQGVSAGYDTLAELLATMTPRTT